VVGNSCFLPTRVVGCVEGRVRTRVCNERVVLVVFDDYRLESRSTVHLVGDEDDGPGPGSAGRGGRGRGGVIGALGGPAGERVRLRQVESEVDPRDLDILGDLGEREQEALHGTMTTGQTKDECIGTAFSST